MEKTNRAYVIFILILLSWFLQACVNNQQHSNDELSAQYNMRLGLAYLSQGNMPLAKSKLLRALKQSPRDANVNSALAYFFERTMDMNLADKYYKIAVNLSANSGAQLNNYASFLCRTGQFQKASRYFMLAINDVHYADTAKVFESAGQCSLAAGNKQQAKVYFKQAIDKDPRLKKSLGKLV